MQSADFNNMRRVMVESQLRTSGVTDAWVLAAMGSLPRENFVPDVARTIAYMDRSIALADGVILNPPVATALMLQHADVKTDDDVLLIGAANGYVETLLATRAKVSTAAASEHFREGRFSLIFIDGAVEELPERVVAAAKDGGRIVTGIVERGVTSLGAGIVRDGKVALRRFADSEIAPLPAFARKPEFVF